MSDLQECSEQQKDSINANTRKAMDYLVEGCAKDMCIALVKHDSEGFVILWAECSEE